MEKQASNKPQAFDWDEADFLELYAAETARELDNPQVYAEFLAKAEGR
ncbi:MAG: hypothetical protein ING29_00800 [Azospirillum sp.]|nr:hypothetical protein [Azospirillum sp.]